MVLSAIFVLCTLFFIPTAFLALFDPAWETGLFGRLYPWVILIVFLLSQILIYPSIFRGMVFIWKLLKNKAIVLVVLIAVTIWIIVWINSGHERKGYDADVRADLKHAANGQEAYFNKNGTYTNSVSDLRKILSGKGISHSSNVNLTVEATTITFVISGNAKEGCSPNSGTWTFNSTTGAIDGTRCR